MDSGYAIIPGVFSVAECEGLIAATADAKRSRAGSRHLMSNARVESLACGTRLLAIASKALGRAVPFRATLFEKSGERNWLIAWHQDTALPLQGRFESVEWGPWSEKHGVNYAHAPGWALSRVIALRVHLDDSAPDNGPLRVIPYSHEAGLLGDDEVLEYTKTHAQIDCPVVRGGVLAMSPLLIHASSKAATAAPRRVLHIEYADSLDLAPGIRLAIA